MHAVNKFPVIGVLTIFLGNENNMIIRLQKAVLFISDSAIKTSNFDGYNYNGASNEVHLA